MNGRLVGNPTWDGHEGPLLDGRTSVAKRYAYIVEADMLEQDVKSDWSGFRGGTRVNEVKRVASEFLANDIRGLTSESRRAKKKAALESNKHVIAQLPPAEAVARSDLGPTLRERRIVMGWAGLLEPSAAPVDPCSRRLHDLTGPPSANRTRTPGHLESRVVLNNAVSNMRNFVQAAENGDRAPSQGRFGQATARCMTSVAGDAVRDRRKRVAKKPADGSDLDGTPTA